MTEPSADELAIRYWLQSARDRLERAEKYDCPKNPALGCEDAQQTVELAPKALITARGSAFKHTHEIEHLFQHLERRIAELRPQIPLTNPRDDYPGKDPKGGTPRTRESAGAAGHEDGSADAGPGEPFKGGVPDRAPLRYRTRGAVDSGRGHESSWDRD